MQRGNTVVKIAISKVILTIAGLGIAGLSMLSFAGSAAAQDINPYGNDCSISPNSAGCSSPPAPNDPSSSSASSSEGSDSGRFNIAWHDNSNNAWIAINYPTIQDARGAAKKACTKIMGGGCTVADWGMRGYIVVYRMLDGTKSFSWAQTPEEARQLMQQACEDQKTECIIINSGDSRGQSEPMVIAPPEHSLRSYAAAARPMKEIVGSVGQVEIFIASGYATRKESESAALLACKEKTKAKCAIAKSVTDGYLMVGIDEKKGAWVALSRDKEFAPGQLAQQCDPASAFCKVTGTFNPKDKGVQAFDAYGKEQN
jgi:Domain of unknown function (DUF4189)